VITESENVRIDTLAEIEEVVEREAVARENGTEIEAPQGATQDEMMMTGRRGEIEIYSMTEEEEGEEEAIEEIAMGGSEEDPGETARRAQAPRPKRRSRRRI
jgi:hypothetical protein